MRKNKPQEGPVDWEQEARTADIANSTYVITLINPVTHRLFDVIHRGTYIDLICPSEKIGTAGAKGLEVGAGYVETQYENRLDEYVRANSPDGVVERGVGYGLLLYCGMAVCAEVNEDARGIWSKKGDRSESAEDFWNSQVTRDFAYEECVDVGTDSTTVEISPTQEDVEEQLKWNVDNTCDVEIEDIEEDVSVEVTYRKSEELQLLTASTVMRSGLALTWVDSPKFDDLKDAWETPPLELLYELKLDNCFDSSLIVALLEQMRDLAGDSFDVKRAVALMETAPPEMFLDPSDELFMEMKQSVKLLRLYQEFAGQLAFDFEAAKERQQELVANQRHSPLWVEHFGDLIEAP